MGKKTNKLVFHKLEGVFLHKEHSHLVLLQRFCQKFCLVSLLGSRRLRLEIRQFDAGPRDLMSNSGSGGLTPIHHHGDTDDCEVWVSKSEGWRKGRRRKKEMRAGWRPCPLNLYPAPHVLSSVSAGFRSFISAAAGTVGDATLALIRIGSCQHESGAAVQDGTNSVGHGRVDDGRTRPRWTRDPLQKVLLVSCFTFRKKKQRCFWFPGFLSKDSSSAGFSVQSSRKVPGLRGLCVSHDALHYLLFLEIFSIMRCFLILCVNQINHPSGLLCNESQQERWNRLKSPDEVITTVFYQKELNDTKTKSQGNTKEIQPNVQDINIRQPMMHRTNHCLSCVF